MHDEKCGCNGIIRAYNPLGHEVKMEIPGQEEKGAPLKRNRWPQTLVKIAAALVFFAPFVCSAEYIKAVNYLGKSWPIAFWNSDLSEVSTDFRTIQEDGFNAIILLVPWGEFQPGVDPIRFNDEAYRQLSMVCNKAHPAGFKVFLRVSYSEDFYPHVQLTNRERANSLMTGNPLIPAWVKYLETIDEATRECSNGVFISWEDFSYVIYTATNLETLEERTAYSKHLGYAAWINRNANSDYKARYATDFRRCGVYPIPRRDNPDFEMFFRYCDDQLINKLLPILAKTFQQASVEARTDSDPIYDGNNLLKWHAHTNHYSITSSDYLMTYWEPATGAVNQGEKESSEKVISRFNYLYRNLLSQTTNQIFIGQWLFTNNDPRFHDSAQVKPLELSQFIRESAQPLAQFTAGYAIWPWRDYKASMPFNGFFSLGKLGWIFSPGASIEKLPDGIVAQLSQGQFIHQEVVWIRRMDVTGFNEEVNLRFTARGEGRLRIDIGSASREVNIKNSSGGQIVTLQFPARSDQDPHLRITALSGRIQLKDLYQWTFEQISNVRSFDNLPGDHYRAIVELNQRLDDPRILVSSFSASNDTIQYLAGAGHPQSDGGQNFAWVGPYAKGKLYAAGPSIAIRGNINIDMFRKAGLFPAGCTLTAFINGEEVTKKLSTQNQPFSMNVKVSSESRGVVTLELRNNCSINLKAMGLGTDVRTLSYRISNIQAEISAK